MRVLPAHTFILDYTSDKINMATSYAPFAQKPFILVFGLSDLAQKDGYNKIWSLSTSYSVNFFKLITPSFILTLSLGSFAATLVVRV